MVSFLPNTTMVLSRWSCSISGHRLVLVGAGTRACIVLSVGTPTRKTLNPSAIFNAVLIPLGSQCGVWKVPGAESIANDMPGTFVSGAGSFFAIWHALCALLSSERRLINVQYFEFDNDCQTTYLWSADKGPEPPMGMESAFKQRRSSAFTNSATNLSSLICSLGMSTSASAKSRSICVYHIMHVSNIDQTDARNSRPWHSTTIDGSTPSTFLMYLLV